MNNFKRKKKKEKKSIEWNTPKKVQIAANKSKPVIRWGYKKKRKECKLHEGAEHIFVEVSRAHYKWVDGTFINLTCGCGKKKIEFVFGNQIKT